VVQSSVRMLPGLAQQLDRGCGEKEFWILLDNSHCDWRGQPRFEIRKRHTYCSVFRYLAHNGEEHQQKNPWSISGRILSVLLYTNHALLNIAPQKHFITLVSHLD